MSKRTAFVTGSTSGIGKGIATFLAKKGYNIVINGLSDKNDISIAISELESFGNKVIYSDADMSSGDEIKESVNNIISKLGSCDIIVNNAGIQHVSPVEDFPEEKWDMILKINLSSAFHMIKAALPSMRKNNFGRIINIASAHGLVGSVNKSAYVAAKHGLVGLTKVVALETAEDNNLTCNTICPGWVLTPLVEKQISAISKDNNISLEEAKIMLLSEKQPSKNFATTDQIASLVYYLCSDEASSITGTSLPVDGGWTAQ